MKTKCQLYIERDFGPVNAVQTIWINNVQTFVENMSLIITFIQTEWLK